MGSDTQADQIKQPRSGGTERLEGSIQPIRPPVRSHFFPISTDGKIAEHTQTYQMDNAQIVKQKNRSAGENESRAAKSSGGRVREKKSQMGRQA